MEVALPLIGSLAVVAAIITLIIRSSMRAYVVGAAPIAPMNEMMRRVGEELGLTFTADGASYGVLSGELRGVAVEVRVVGAYYDYWMQLCARGTKALANQAKQHFTSCNVRFKDGWVVLEPPVHRIKAGRYRHLVISDPAALRRWIEDLASFAAR